MAVGISALLLGVECLGIEKVTLSTSATAPSPEASSWFGSAQKPAGKEFVPAPWMPWSMMAAGVVICLYTMKNGKPAAE